MTTTAVEYAIRYADPYDACATLTEPIGAGSVERYQREEWCVVLCRTVTEWTEVTR